MMFVKISTLFYSDSLEKQLAKLIITILCVKNQFGRINKKWKFWFYSCNRHVIWILASWQEKCILIFQCEKEIICLSARIHNTVRVIISTNNKVFSITWSGNFQSKHSRFKFENEFIWYSCIDWLCVSVHFRCYIWRKPLALIIHSNKQKKWLKY